MTVAEELHLGDVLTARGVLSYEGGPDLDAVGEHTVGVLGAVRAPPGRRFSWGD